MAASPDPAAPGGPLPGATGGSPARFRLFAKAPPSLSPSPPRSGAEEGSESIFGRECGVAAEERSARGVGLSFGGVVPPSRGASSFGRIIGPLRFGGAVPVGRAEREIALLDMGSRAGSLRREAIASPHVAVLEFEGFQVRQFHTQPGFPWRPRHERTQGLWAARVRCRRSRDREKCAPVRSPRHLRCQRSLRQWRWRQVSLRQRSRSPLLESSSE